MRASSPAVDRATGFKWPSCRVRQHKRAELPGGMLMQYCNSCHPVGVLMTSSFLDGHLSCQNRDGQSDPQPLRFCRRQRAVDVVWGSRRALAARSSARSVCSKPIKRADNDGARRLQPSRCDFLGPVWRPERTGIMPSVLPNMGFLLLSRILRPRPRLFQEESTTVIIILGRKHHAADRAFGAHDPIHFAVGVGVPMTCSGTSRGRIAKAPLLLIDVEPPRRDRTGVSLVLSAGWWQSRASSRDRGSHQGRAVVPPSSGRSLPNALH